VLGVCVSAYFKKKKMREEKEKREEKGEFVFGKEVCTYVYKI
jgi:hypothetical protein